MNENNHTSATALQSARSQEVEDEVSKYIDFLNNDSPLSLDGKFSFDPVPLPTLTASEIARTQRSFQGQSSGRRPRVVKTKDKVLKRKLITAACVSAVALAFALSTPTL